MTTDANKRSMHRFTEFMNTASDRLAADLISPNAIFHVPGRSEPMRRPAGYLAIIGMILGGHLKTGHTWSLQSGQQANPEQTVVIPCLSLCVGGGYGNAGMRPERPFSGRKGGAAQAALIWYDESEGRNIETFGLNW